ncbi:HPr kinase/phosphorylase [Sphingomonas sp. LaA6.9]|uniref:HPr kinase/phosphorylase n=1 Tax=Sphingomonas sp. LaA6.9 TaxID=2919914 RepID=UPI001F5023A7|nr:HPr kinase/phosphatase C-terminal domain-containing protein [Sphingomonas sp. LaA6.9]MCJ8157343.1 HPr kinase/phosphatase C-terminal domain-containing protein [Sphingomonas sp. LaA6.9]
MASLSSEMLHASSVEIGGRAVLIEGRSGSGKSDLALRLIDRGARLISDDYTLVKRDKAALLATAAPNIAGKIEVRGLGIIELGNVEDVPVGIVVTLGDPVERIPASDVTRRIAGVAVPVVALNGLEASAPVKVELALRQIGMPASA